ncbi:YceI family protein [Pseudonocardia sp. GCM10023141]|uniref:YceI family protein n=1 Tax=Pseudonocardia sp. GCM10023141 TaxID=3252653 RepID=UPI00361082D6
MTAVAGLLSTPDGWPVPGGTLTAVDMTGVQRGRTASNTDGRFALDDLPAGLYTLIVAAAGHDPLARTVTVGSGPVTDLGVLELPRAGGAVLPAPGTWTIDPVHSSIRATALHLGMSRVHGRLGSFSGQVQVADPLEHSSVEVLIDPSAVATDDAMRDEHLRSADFLDVLAYPEIRYKSEGLRRTDATHWVVDGVLTLKDVSAHVPLQVLYRGTGPDPWGGVRAGFTATAEVSRDDFAIRWNQSVLAGLLVVGRTLRIDIDIEAVRS